MSGSPLVSLRHKSINVASFWLLRGNAEHRSFATVTARQQRFLFHRDDDFSPGKQMVCRYACVNAVRGPVQGSLKSDRGPPSRAKRPPLSRRSPITPKPCLHVGGPHTFL